MQHKQDVGLNFRKVNILKHRNKQENGICAYVIIFEAIWLNKKK